MKCSKCSKDYDDSFEFCPYCAEPKPDLTPTTPPAPSPEEEVSQQATPPGEEAAAPTDVAAVTEKKPPRFSKKTKGVAAVVIILLVIGLAVGLIVGLSGGGNETETFNEFVRKVQFGYSTSDSAIREMVSEETLKEYSDDPNQFDRLFYSYAKALLGDGATITATEVTNNRVAIIKYKSEANGQNYTATLVTEKGAWKVFDVWSTDEMLENSHQKYNY